MTANIAVILRQEPVVAIPADVTAPRGYIIGQGPRGEKGDPGGNIGAIGLFVDASGLSITVGVDAVRTTGHDIVGVGIADYYWDSAVDVAWVAAHPETSFITTNGRGFRIAYNHGDLVPDRTTLAGIDIIGEPDGYMVYLTEAGREGWFVWSTDDHEDDVTADTYEAIYIAPVGLDGSTGAWIRKVEGRDYKLTWWGVVPGTNASLPLRHAVGINPDGTRMVVRVVPDGARLELPSFGFNLETVSDSMGVAVPVWNPIEIFGDRTKTVINLTHYNVRYHSFVVMGSGIRLHDFTMTGLEDATNADSAFPIRIGGRHYTTKDEPLEIEDIEVDHVTIRDCTAGIRVAYQPYIVSGTPVDITPRRVKVHHNHVETSYQGIVPEADEIEVYSNTIVRPVGSGDRPFNYLVRILGCANINIHDNDLINGTLAGNFVFSNAGVDGHDIGDLAGSGDIVEDFRVARNVKVHHNTVYLPEAGAMLVINGCADSIELSNNVLEIPLDDTRDAAAVYINDILPLRQSTVKILNNTFRGASRLVQAQNTNLKHLIVEGNDLIANSKGGSRYDIISQVYINNTGTDSESDPIEGVQILEVMRNRVKADPGPQNHCVTVTGTKSNHFAAFYDNIFPADDGAPFPPSIIAGDGAGTVITDSTMTPVLWSAGTPAVGSNRRYPAGVWETTIDDVAPYKGTTPI